MFQTYTDILDRLDGKRAQIGEKKMAHLSFPMKEFALGQVYKAEITFRVTGTSLSGTDLEVLDLKNQGEEADEEIRIVPAPS